MIVRKDKGLAQIAVDCPGFGMIILQWISWIGGGNDLGVTEDVVATFGKRDGILHPVIATYVPSYVNVSLCHE